MISVHISRLDLGSRASGIAAWVLAVVSVLGLALSASAADVQAGYDFFQSQPGFGGGAGGTFADLSGLGLGFVNLEGVPFSDPLLSGDSDFASADTIVRRDLDALDPIDAIPIELVSLSLKSIDPVDLTPLGGPFIGVLSDLWITVNQGGLIPNLPVYDPLNPLIGQMEIIHTSPAGGQFNSCLGDPADPGSCGALGVPGGGVYADAIFVVPGGDPNNLLDVLINTPAPRVAVSSSGSTWEHETGPPSGGPPGPPWQPRNFRILTIIHTGPHPVFAVLFGGGTPALSTWGLGIVVALLGGVGVWGFRKHVTA